MKFIGNLFSKVRGKVGAAVAAIVAVVAVVMGDVASAASIDMPVDFEALAGDGMTVVGKVMGAIAAIIIVIALVRMGFRFLSSAFQGRV